jgi:Fe-S cluster assembly iron-binding protein IscA
MDQLEVIREQNSLADDQGITLVPMQDGQLGFAATVPQAQDEKVERDGKLLMVIPEALVEPLGSVTIDFVDTPEAQGFTLNQAG